MIDGLLERATAVRRILYVNAGETELGAALDGL